MCDIEMAGRARLVALEVKLIGLAHVSHVDWIGQSMNYGVS